MPACHAGDRRFESGRVRHLPHFPTPRPPARTGRSLARCYDRCPMKRLPLLVVLGLLALAVAVPMSGGMLGFGGASPGPSGIAIRPIGSPGATGTPAASTEA